MRRIIPDAPLLRKAVRSRHAVEDIDRDGQEELGDEGWAMVQVVRVRGDDVGARDGQARGRLPGMRTSGSSSQVGSALARSLKACLSWDRTDSGPWASIIAVEGFLPRICVLK